jgi:hypothetical protein
MKLKIVRVSMITFMVNKPLFHKRAKKMKQFLIIMYMLMKREAANGEPVLQKHGDHQKNFNSLNY